MRRNGRIAARWPRCARSAALALVLLSSSAAGASAATSAQAPTVIRLVSVTTAVRILADKPPKGVSAGDRIEARSRLSNAVAQFGRAKGAVVGSDVGSIANLGTATATIDVVATLPGGTIRVRGKGRAGAGGAVIVPVVGGTGRFVGARGTLTVEETSGTRASNVYRLSYGLAA